MFDEGGGEYFAAKAQIGGKVSQFYIIGPDVTNSLVPRVPTKLVLNFDNVSPEAKTVTLLGVNFQWIDSNSVDLNADFRGITLTK